MWLYAISFLGWEYYSILLMILLAYTEATPCMCTIYEVDAELYTVKVMLSLPLRLEADVMRSFVYISWLDSKNIY